MWPLSKWSKLSRVDDFDEDSVECGLCRGEEEEIEDWRSQAPRDLDGTYLTLMSQRSPL